MTKSQTDKPETSAAHGVWCLYSAGLYMRADTTDAGRLVRLADVVRWVMYRDELPIVDAVESVCVALESACPAPALFQVCEHSSAFPVAPMDSFGFFTDELLARAKRFVEPYAQGEPFPPSYHPIALKDHAPSQFLIRGQVVTNRETAQKALEYLNGEVSKPVRPGAHAAAKYMREYWADWGFGAFFSGNDWASDATLDKRELKTSGLSVSVADAARVWGWGRAAESTSEPEEAPQAAAPERTNFAMLATREQLIEAFGPFTGMNADWFTNLRDTPALRDARRITGQGGRNAAAPYFCPFAAMQWLVSPKRRKGRPLSERKGWELLEKHFPGVYASRSIGDPREAD